MGSIDIELVIGWFFVMFGGFGGLLYLWELTGHSIGRAFSRRQRYIERMGKKGGTIWHLVRYVITPIVVGLLIILF